MTRPFHFRQFTIRQERTPMKVGTDGVLLGAWADMEGAHRILDIGTGTGLIALMAAQRAPRAHVHAVEPHRPAFEEACENFSASPFSDRVAVEHVGIDTFSPDESFDLILCNPPYFLDDLPSPDPGRMAARHAGGLTPAALAEKATKWAGNGKLSTIYPPQAFAELEKQIVDRGWVLVRRAFVQPVAGKPAHRILSEFSPRALDQIPNPAEETIAIRSHGGGPYSPAYMALTSEFYLSDEDKHRRRNTRT